MNESSVYRFLFWVFLIAGTLLVWARIFFLHGRGWFLLIAICLACSALAYILMFASYLEEGEREDQP